MVTPRSVLREKENPGGLVARVPLSVQETEKPSERERERDVKCGITKIITLLTNIS